MIEESKIREIVNKIAIGFSPDRIILFGSYATGQANEDSDLDLLIVKDTDLPMHKRNIEIRKALIGTKVPMDLLVYTNYEYENEKNQKYSFLYQLTDKTQTLYERQSR